MPSIPICPPVTTAASSGPPPVVYLAAAVGVGKVVGEVLGYTAPEAITGYQHVKAGGKYVDDTLAILNDKVRGEEALSPHQRGDLIEQHAQLNEKRIRLDEQTKTYSGSVRYWNDGRMFHNDAYDLHTSTRISSDDGVARRVKALAKMQATGEKEYQPPGFPYEPVRHPKKHDEGTNGSADYPWAPSDQGSSSHPQAPSYGYPQYPGPQNTAAYGQQQQNMSYPQPGSSQVRAHPNMSSSQWAQHTAATATYPSYPPSGIKHSGRP